MFVDLKRNIQNVLERATAERALIQYFNRFSLAIPCFMAPKVRTNCYGKMVYLHDYHRSIEACNLLSNF